MIRMKRANKHVNINTLCTHFSFNVLYQYKGVWDSGKNSGSRTKGALTSCVILAQLVNISEL